MGRDNWLAKITIKVDVPWSRSHQDFLVSKIFLSIRDDHQLVGFQSIARQEMYPCQLRNPIGLELAFVVG